METEYSFFTDRGSREVNEDSAGMTEKNGAYCFILCDGLGGHGMGEAASRLAVQTAKEFFLSAPDTEHFAANVTDKLHTALRQRQAAIGASGKMKTTAAILVLDGDKGCCVHVGDSRVYRFRGGRVISRTRDHSIPQMLCITGDITEEKIRSHPDRNKLLRALGDDKDQVKFELSRFDISAGDSFLLCSDGFWEPVLEAEMEKALFSGNAKDWLSIMAAAAKNNSRGRKMDNYTAVTVMLKE